MKKIFEILDFKETHLGDLTLQRRQMLQLDRLEVYEVKLNEEYLMSSLFHDVEVELANFGLADLKFSDLNLVVGGLGLGYTAVSALKNSKVKRLKVVETLLPVIEWHQAKLVPLGETLSKDPRCEFVHADFFKLAKEGFGFKPDELHAVLLDIDHTPEHFLHRAHAEFYSKEGLLNLSKQLVPGAVFAMWSDGKPNAEFLKLLKMVFADCEAKEVEFFNPLQNKNSSSCLYKAIRA